MVEKANPNYEASAVNLVNPPEIEKALYERLSFTSHIANLKATLEAYPEYNDLQKAEQRLADHDGYIRGLIDQHGSYQDLKAGTYAVKQVRKSVTFIADKVRQILPQYAEAVIDGVNKSKLEGLVKGGLVTQDQVDQCGQTKESFAYIIR